MQGSKEGIAPYNAVELAHECFIDCTVLVDDNKDTQDIIPL